MSTPVSFNGTELYVSVAEKAWGLRVGFDLDEWRGLRLRLGQRVPVRLGERADVWLTVAAVTPTPPTCWVEFRERYDGPVEEPEPRGRRRAAAAEEPAAEPVVRYEAQVIDYPGQEYVQPEDRPSPEPMPAPASEPTRWARSIFATFDENGRMTYFARSGEAIPVPSEPDPGPPRS